MELKFVTATSRSAVVELTESGKFYTEKPYEIYVDGSKYMDSEKVVTTLYGLKPDTLYKVSAAISCPSYTAETLYNVSGFKP